MLNYDFIAPLNERLSIAKCESLLRHDLCALMTDPNSISPQNVSENIWGYYMCANTWVLLVEDLGGTLLGNLLRSVISTEGLVSAIREAANASDVLVASANGAEVLCEMSTVKTDIGAHLKDGRMKEWLVRTSRLPFRISRMLLVYPKRYSPIVPATSSVQHEQAIMQFQDTNKANVEHERRISAFSAYYWYSRTGEAKLALPFKSPAYEESWDQMAGVVDCARRLLKDAINTFEGFSTIRQVPRVGPGACRNAGRAKFERMITMAQCGEYRLSLTPSRGFSFLPHIDSRERQFKTYRTTADGQKRRTTKVVPPRAAKGFWGKGNCKQFCRITTVPKSWKARRLIALEDVCNMARQLGLKDLLDKRMASSGYSLFIPIRNQESNQERAAFGALTNELATLDLSHASDSVTKPLVRLLFPEGWYELGFERCVPFGYVLHESDERVQPLHMFATMGCGCTFAVEALVFFSLVAGTILYDRSVAGDASVSIWEYRDLIRVMGDDIICPSQDADSVIQTLTFFGFAVNNDKSFIRGRFRESCGSDWIKYDDRQLPVNVTCQYWPRIPVGGDPADIHSRTFLDYNVDASESEVVSPLSRVIALQHKLFDLSPSASTFLFDLLRERCPSLSTSFPGENDRTLWTNTPLVTDVYAVSLGSKDLAEYSHLCQNYCSEREAVEYFSNLYWSSGKGFMQPSIYAESQWVRSQLTAARRKMICVPTTVASTLWKGFDPFTAEILYLEQSLLALEAQADQILPIAVIGPSEQIVEHYRARALQCVRPARLSWSKLIAESYETCLEYIVV